MKKDLKIALDRLKNQKDKIISSEKMKHKISHIPKSKMGLIKHEKP